MSITTRIEPEHKLVIHTVSGDFGLVDVQPAWQAMLAHPDFRPDMNVMWDFRGITNLKDQFSSADIQQIASMTVDHLQQREKKYRLALVAERDLLFGFSRMFAAYTGELPMDLRVFRSLDEARAWLLE